MKVLLRSGWLAAMAAGCCTPVVSPAADPPKSAFERIEIDAQPPNSPWIKAVGDLNGDGRPDVIIGGSSGPLVWYANPNWRRSVIAAGGYDSVDAEAADVDEDGDLDVVVGGALWYENPRPDGDPARSPWRAHRIGTHATHDVEVADLDKDGKLDVVLRGQSGFGHKEGNRIVIFKQLSPTSWSSREITCPDGEGLKLADLNRDGRPDIVLGGRWHENRGEILKGAWREHVFTTAWTHADCKVDVGDFNGDGRLDVVLTPAEFRGGKYRIAWYEAPADPASPQWPEHVIEASIETVVHGLAVADVNGDGRADVVAARMHQGDSPQEASVYVNAEAGRKWTKLVVSTKGSHNIVAADIDGDARPDILGANHGGPFQPVEVWMNRLPTPR